MKQFMRIRTSIRAYPLLFAAMLVIAAMVSPGCSDDNPTNPGSNPVSKYSAEVPVNWCNLHLSLVKTTPGFTPPVASRAFGYMGVALYESLVPGMPDHKSLAGQLNELSSVPQPEEGMEYHWPTVANSVLARITKQLFANTSAENVARIDSLESALVAGFIAEADGAVIDRSVAYGKAVADAIYEWSKTDGGHEGYTRNFPANYIPPVGPGLWVPTPRPGGLPPQNALQPYWGQNRPFVLPMGNPNMGIDPGAPPVYSEEVGSAFYNEGLEVYNTVKNLTQEQRDIALFWADDPGATSTPPGHSMSILTQCIVQESSKLDFAAEAYAKAGIAVADAFIACWESKYKYNLVRPITYIQSVIDQTWNTPDVTDPVGTPPFPEYTSGHSVQSGAASRILTNLMGESFAFTDHTHDARGMTSRSFTSFYGFADEAAISRLYGGIHYRAAIERGVDQGKKVADKVLALQFTQ